MSAIRYPSHQGRLLLFGQGDLAAGDQTHYEWAQDKKEKCCKARGSLLSPGPCDTPLARMCLGFLSGFLSFTTVTRPLFQEPEETDLPLSGSVLSHGFSILPSRQFSVRHSPVWTFLRVSKLISSPSPPFLPGWDQAPDWQVRVQVPSKALLASQAS